MISRLQYLTFILLFRFTHSHIHSPLRPPSQHSVCVFPFLCIFILLLFLISLLWASSFFVSIPYFDTPATWFDTLINRNNCLSWHNNLIYFFLYIYPTFTLQFNYKLITILLDFGFKRDWMNNQPNPMLK